MQKLSSKQAYLVTQQFLKEYYFSNIADNLVLLLSAMPFWEDGGTADPAIWSDWLDATYNKENLTIQEAYNAMIKFLEDFNERISFPEDVTNLINSLKPSSEKYKEMWDKWLEAINYAEKNNGIFLRLTR